MCCFLIRNVLHFYGFPLDLCRKCITNCGEMRRIFTGKAPQLYKTPHFQELRCTQRDKRGVRYAALISAAAAHLLDSFLRIPYVHLHHPYATKNKKLVSLHQLFLYACTVNYPAARFIRPPISVCPRTHNCMTCIF